MSQAMAELLTKHRQRMDLLATKEVQAFERIAELSSRLIFANAAGNVPEAAKPLVKEILENGLVEKIA